jgi:hypothetical protein
MGMNDMYKLEPSRFNPGWWVCTDTVNLLVCTFKEGKFNETQKFTDLEGNDVYQSMDGVMAHIRIMREMSDWLAVNHPNIIFE